MFLSEMLPPDRVQMCVLLDKAWPIWSADPKVLPGQINFAHIYGSDDLNGNYSNLWPIPLYTTKRNLKRGKEIRNLNKTIFDRVSGPVLMLGIHLCGTLALRAVNIFNEHDCIKFFALKPCCLPNMVHMYRNETFAIGTHTFDAKL